VTDIVQGSPEWIAIRLGKVTASRVADVVARTKSGWGASRANYMAELIAERLTGVAVARHGYGRPSRRIEMIEAGHPVPDAAGAACACIACTLAEKLAANWPKI